MPPPPPPPAPPPIGGPGYQPQRNHPRATTSLVLGILSLVICSILGPVALVMGRKAVKEIDASGGELGGRGQAQVGWILGLIATILLAISIVVVVIALAAGS